MKVSVVPRQPCTVPMVSVVATILVSFHMVAQDVDPITVRFDTADRAPSPILQIDGVTISSPDGGYVATEAGQGLGMATAGAISSLDLVYEPAGRGKPKLQACDHWLTLQAPGPILSVTLIPWSSGPSPTTFHAALYSLVPDRDLQFVLLSLADPSPITVHLPQPAEDAPYDERFASLSLRPWADRGVLDELRDYSREIDTLESNYEIGFRVVLTRYSPVSAAVPEPASFSLIVLSALCLLARRGRSSRAEWKVGE